MCVCVCGRSPRMHQNLAILCGCDDFCRSLQNRDFKPQDVRNNRKGGVPKAYVRTRASNATLCSVHVSRVFLCISLSKAESDTYQNGFGYISDTNSLFSSEIWPEFRRKRDLYEPLLTAMAQVFSFPISCSLNRENPE